MPDKTVAQKARVKPGSSIAVINGVDAVVAGLGLPGDARFVDPAEASIVLLFVTSRSDLDTLMPPAIAGLATGAALWVFFRKGSKAAGNEINRDDVWALAETLGMRPLGILGVDDTWSVFRLRLG